MLINYTRPGPLEIMLDSNDVTLLLESGYTMTRGGLTGPLGSKTHVEVSDTEEPAARIDGNADITFSVPVNWGNATAKVSTEKITGFGDDLDSRINHYFGEYGGVVVFFSGQPPHTSEVIRR